MELPNWSSITDVLVREQGVRLVYSFGSWARGEATPRSDVDIGVVLAQPPTGDAENGLRSALADVDPRVDLVVLNGAPVVLRYEVVNAGRCLFARSERDQAEFEINVMAAWRDWQPILRVQREYLRQRVEERRRGATSRSAS